MPQSADPDQRHVVPVRRHAGAWAQLTALSASRMAELIAAREITSTELVAAHQAAYEALSSHLNALAIPRFEQAHQAAQAADDLLTKGDLLGPLHGVPFTVKECFAAPGADATLGFVRDVGQPAVEAAPVVQQLEAAGGVLIGKTNLAQGMLLFETDNPVYGCTHHPYDEPGNSIHSPGGSSGGEAAWIAAGGSPCGIGTDLGGSIRQPAHACGICGFKPPSGMLSSDGCRLNLPNLISISLAPGPMARTPEDIRLLMHVLRPDRFSRSAQSVDALRIGVCCDDGCFPPSASVRRAVNAAASQLAAAGAQLDEFEFPDADLLLEVYLGLIAADGLDPLHEAGGPYEKQVRKEIFLARLNRPMRRMLAWGLSMCGQSRMAQLVHQTGRRTTAELRELIARQAEFRANLVRQIADRRFDAVIMPPHALPAMLHGQALNLTGAASYCFLANLCDLPAGVAPVTTVRSDELDRQVRSIDAVERAAAAADRASRGLPIGVQVLAPVGREEAVLDVIQAIAWCDREATPPTASP